MRGGGGKNRVGGEQIWEIHGGWILSLSVSLSYICSCLSCLYLSCTQGWIRIMNEKSPVGSTVIFITSPCNTVLSNVERQGLNLICSARSFNYVILKITTSLVWFCSRLRHPVCELRSFSKALYTLSVKLSDFTVWRHTWRKNWVNCAVLTGNSAGLRTVLSSCLSHRKLRSSLRESQSFLSLLADTTMASSQGTQPLTIHSTVSIAWYIPF